MNSEFDSCSEHRNGELGKIFKSFLITKKNRNLVYIYKYCDITIKKTVLQINSYSILSLHAVQYFLLSFKSL